MKRWYAWLDQRPSVLMKWSGMPVDAEAEVAAPIRKTWLLKDEPWRAAVKMKRSQWIRCVAPEVEVGT